MTQSWYRIENKTDAPALKLPGMACLLPAVGTGTGSRTGTKSGYYAHQSAGEKPCIECRLAYNAAQTAKRRQRGERRDSTGTSSCARPTADHPEGRTGTRAGYMAHYYDGEQPCPACKAGHTAAVAADKADDPEKELRMNLRYKYRLSVDDYRDMLARQNGRCAICGVDAPTDIRTNRFHVDHDHKCCPGSRSCGRCTRGLLCHACNTALGNFKDDPEILRAALDYLGRTAGAGDG